MTVGTVSALQDAALSSRDQDELGLRKFAEDIATLIRSSSAADGIVIGLYGPWGCGKTSIKNMIREMLKSKGGEEEAPKLVEFNPWMISGVEDLHLGFFRAVSTAIGKRDPKVYKVAAHRLRVYLKALQIPFGKPRVRVARWIDRGLAFLIGAGTITTIAGIHIASVLWVVLGGLASVLVVVVYVAGLAERLVDFFDQVAAPPITPSEAKGLLSAELAKIPSSLLVIIDDIDRLRPEDVRTVFQLVKAHGDLPKISYLLLYDREAVEKCLSEPEPPRGAEAIAKFVQVPIRVPEVWQDRLEGMLSTRLATVMKREMETAGFDQVRWQRIQRAGFASLLQTPREVKRFVAGLSFQLEAHREDEVLNVNPIDLAALEAVRTVAPGVYERLPAAKDLLLGPDLVPRVPRPETDRPVDDLLADISPRHQTGVRRILEQVFPLFFASGARSRASNESLVEWAAELRAAHPRLFERYFTASVFPGDISESEFRRLVAAIDRPDQLRTALEAFLPGRRWGTLMVRLVPWIRTQSREVAERLLPILLDMGEHTYEEAKKTPLEGFDLHLHYGALLSQTLEKIEADRDIGGLKRAIATASGLVGPLLAVSDLVMAGRNRPPQVEGDAASELKGIAVGRIRDYAAADRLLASSALMRVLQKWNLWAPSGEARSWFRSILADRGRTASLLRGLALFSVVSGRPGHFGEVVNWYLPVKEILELASVKEIDAAVAALEQAPLTDDDRRTVDLYRVAREALDKGEDPSPRGDAGVGGVPKVSDR